jgi:hypothetical protein
VENRREGKKYGERRDGCSREETYISVENRKEDKKAE